MHGYLLAELTPKSSAEQVQQIRMKTSLHNPIKKKAFEVITLDVSALGRKQYSVSHGILHTYHIGAFRDNNRGHS